MTNIKVVGLVIFILSITLAVLSSYISNENKLNNALLDEINVQKGFTQEISKNIFYIYKNKDATSSQQLDDSIRAFIKNLDNRNKTLKKINSDAIEKESEEIIVLWNKFYLYVQNYRDQSKTVSTYSSILLEQLVNDIYNTNIKLVMKFNKLIQLYNEHFEDTLNSYKILQYVLFLALALLLIYLFSQIKDVISFMQKFIQTSKNIITNSSIKDLQPINVNNNSSELLEASNNFNFLVDKINNSIRNSSQSIEYSFISLQQLENNIEDLLELLCIMDKDENIDKELTKREDTLIQSLEELTSSTIKLENLKSDLDNLVASYKLKHN
jgi:methyl-accepting chemotaxis protein